VIFLAQWHGFRACQRINGDRDYYCESHRRKSKERHWKGVLADLLLLLIIITVMNFKI
jgi:hypothetical protein